jgi:hypothetical protein
LPTFPIVISGSPRDRVGPVTLWQAGWNDRSGRAVLSASVLGAIARALQLDDAERAHLFHHAADGTSGNAAPTPTGETLDAAAQPAVAPGHHHRPRVGNGRMHLLAVNDLGRAMYSSLYDSDSGGPPNLPRYTLKSPTTHTASTPTGTAPPTPA